MSTNKQKFNFAVSKKIVASSAPSALGSNNDITPDAPGALGPQSDIFPNAPGALDPKNDITPDAPGALALKYDITPDAPGALGPKSDIFPNAPGALGNNRQRMEIRYVPRRKIRINKKNNYPMSELESLKNSILHYGLQQPMTVMYLMEEDIYVLEAGHRRCNVLDQLIDTYKDFEDEEDENYQIYCQTVSVYETGYPCIVADRLGEDMYYDIDDDELSDKAIDSEIRLIITNEEVRSVSSQVKAQNVQRLTKLYSLKNKGKKHCEKININKQIASDLGLKPRQVATYQAVNTLIPELKELFDANNITLKEGSSYASLSEEDQFTILQLIQAGNQVREEDVKLIKQERKDLEKKYEQLVSELKNKESELVDLKKALDESQSSITDSEAYKQIQKEKYDMEETILELKNTILAMENKQKQNKTKFDEKAMLTKLKLQAAYQAAYNSIEEFVKLCDNYIETDKTYTKEYENLVNNLHSILKGEEK